jgi:hypothetical protein
VKKRPVVANEGLVADRFAAVEVSSILLLIPARTRKIGCPPFLPLVVVYLRRLVASASVRILTSPRIGESM